MGSGVSAAVSSGIAAAVSSASQDELHTFFQGVGVEEKAKVLAGLSDGAMIRQVSPAQVILTSSSSRYKDVTAKRSRGSLCKLNQSFPMYVVRVLDVLDMTELVPHADLLKANLLVEYDETLGYVLFVSHQWLDIKTPDPKFQQFQVLIDVLNNIIDGSTVVKNNLQGAIHGMDGTMMKDMALWLQDAYIWYDFFGVPQLRDRLVDAQSTAPPPLGMIEAINSLPAYVQRSTCFLVLAPLCVNADLGTDFNLASWLIRGWCNMEVFCSSLAPIKQAQLVIQGPKDIEIMEYALAKQYHPGEGNFSVESDREVIAPIMAEVIASKINTMESSDPCGANGFRVYQRRLLDGLPVKEAEPTANCAKALEVLLQKYGFSSATELDKNGWSPLHFAAVEGQSDLVQELVSIHKIPVDLASTEHAANSVSKGSTPMLAAVSLGSATAAGIVATLVGLKADINGVEQSIKGTVLHTAVFRRNVTMVQATLDARANIELRNAVGMTPLHVAALFCSAAIVPLLASGAKTDVLTKDMQGAIAGLATQKLVRTNFNEHLKKLLDAKCDINGTDQQPFVSGTVPRALAMHLKIFGEDRSPTPSDGSMPPLLAAIYSNNASSALALVEAGADLRTTWLGRSLSEHARRCDRTSTAWQKCFPEVTSS